MSRCFDNDGIQSVRFVFLVPLDLPLVIVGSFWAVVVIVATTVATTTIPNMPTLVPLAGGGGQRLLLGPAE
jgi:hypothetical protein